MKSNPGKSMAMCDFPGIPKESLPRAVTPFNIQRGFEVSGIYPFNSNILSDEEFLPVYVSGRPDLQRE